jgi:hypothetical protein
LLKKFAISIKKISLVAISFLLFFVIFDFIFSNYIFKEKLDLKYDCFEYKNHIFKGQDYHDYRLLKNCEAIEKQRTVKPYKVYTDENGYRYSKRKRQNQLVNIVFLGDSFTYGYGVDYKDSFPGIIENKIKNYEIYNLAAPGYGTQKYHYQLNEFFKKKTASKIFLILDMTDISDAAFRWNKIDEIVTPVIKSKHVLKNISDWKKFKNSNFKGTRLLIYNLRNFLRFLKLKIISTNMGSKDRALSSEIANFTYKKLDHDNKLNQTKLLNAINIIKNNFQKISNLAKKNNANLYLVIFPWPETLINGQSEFNWEKFAANLCSKNNCKKLINLFEDFNYIKENNQNWKNLIYIDDDVHLKKFGNEIIASKIIKELIN